MTGRGAEYKRERRLSLLEDFDGAPYPDEIQQAFRVRMEAVLDEIEGAYEVIVFADGLCLHHTGDTVLADLYNETCGPAEVLRQAGTWPRGSFKRGSQTVDSPNEQESHSQECQP